jgi:DNA-binding transcriptional LysR family regulator
MESGALALSHSLASARSAATGTVRVTTSQVAASWLLPPVIAALQAAEPGITIELVAAAPPDRLRPRRQHRAGFARFGLPLARERIVLRTDDQVAHGRLVASGAGIGFVAQYNIRHWPGVTALLPMLTIPPLPCWLAVHREIRSNRLVRRVYDFLAEAVPRELAGQNLPVRRDSRQPVRRRSTPMAASWRTYPHAESGIRIQRWHCCQC